MTATASRVAPGCHRRQLDLVREDELRDQAVPTGRPPEIDHGVAADRGSRQGRDRPLATDATSSRVDGPPRSSDITWSARKPPLGLNSASAAKRPGGNSTTACLPVARSSSSNSAHPSACRRPGDLGRTRRDHSVERAAGLRARRLAELVGRGFRPLPDRRQQQAAVGCLVDHVPGREPDRRPHRHARQADLPRRPCRGVRIGGRRITSQPHGAGGGGRRDLVRPADPGRRPRAVGQEPDRQRRHRAIAASGHAGRTGLHHPAPAGTK